MRKRVVFAISLIGFTSMAGQIVLMRELLAVFYGNELTLGLMLASWLFWVAAGSWLAGRISAKNSIGVFAACQTALAFALPLSVLAAKSVPAAFRFSPGEIIGILHMAFAAFILLAPACLVSGALFVSACGIFSDGKEDAAGIGRVYILEAAGAVLGGLAASWVFIRMMSGFHALLFVAFLNILSALFLLGKKWAVIFLGVFALLFTNSSPMEAFFLRAQWKGRSLLAVKDSIYGNVAVAGSQNQHSVFINGIHEFTVPDEVTEQMNAHIPLLQHPDPQEVLLIGGGSSGMLKEVLKHPAKKIDYVELDPLVIELSKKYTLSGAALKNPRVKVHTDIDGRLFVKRARKKYDAVIVNLPGPHTAQLNRFYTREFFKEVKNALKDRGVFSFRLDSNPNYISREQAQFYNIVKNTLESAFEETFVTPGGANYFFASDEKGAFTFDAGVLNRRLKRRQIEAPYIRDYYLPGELTAERIYSFKTNLAQSRTDKINTDLEPVGYYYNLVLWNTFFKYNLKGLFKSITEKRIYTAAAALFFLLLILGRGRGVLVCVGTTGFAEIAFQIITLIAFQAAYGYVYYKLGIIMTSFMAGLILGGLAATKRLEGKIRGDKGEFIKAQALICIYPLLLPLFFKEQLSPFLQVLPVIPGFIGGYQFPLANKLYLAKMGAKMDAKTGTVPSATKVHVGGSPRFCDSPRFLRSAGLTYSVDLFGSCLGALLVSVFLIPVIGLPMACITVSALNFIALTTLL